MKSQFDKKQAGVPGAKSGEVSQLIGAVHGVGKPGKRLLSSCQCPLFRPSFVLPPPVQAPYGSQARRGWERWLLSTKSEAVPA